MYKAIQDYGGENSERSNNNYFEVVEGHVDDKFLVNGKKDK